MPSALSRDVKASSPYITASAERKMRPSQTYLRWRRHRSRPALVDQEPPSQDRVTSSAEKVLGGEGPGHRGMLADESTNAAGAKY